MSITRISGLKWEVCLKAVGSEVLTSWKGVPSSLTPHFFGGRA